MPNGGVLSIYSKLREREKTFLLGVSDTGEGIAPETLRRVREPFFTTKASGTGLGIPICEKILAAHNGKLQIKSDVGKGTTVEIVFPIS
jgi:signal transduction histidine kinase